MNDKLKNIIPIFFLIYYLIIVPIILYNFIIYLKKPPTYIWNQVEEYLVNSGKYSNEPIIFNPSWLKNYATDYSRFKKFNIAKNNSRSYTYWLISMDSKSIPNNYQIIVNKKIANLFILKLERR